MLLKGAGFVFKFKGEECKKNMSDLISELDREIFDLRAPQKSLVHTGIPSFVNSDTDTAQSVREAFLHSLKNPKFPDNKISLWQESESAFDAFAKAVFPNKEVLQIALWSPAPLQRAASHKILEISRDPNDWTADELNACDLILIQNPTLWDGYYLPEDLLRKSIEIAQRLNPNIAIFIDQRSLVFCWEDLAPGDARRLPFTNHFAILNSTHPVLAPHIGPEVAWLESNLLLKGVSGSLSASNLKAAMFIVSSFKTKQGPFSAEFNKVMLVVRESLKRLSSSLQILSSSHGFKITHWPSSGLFLRLQCESELDAARLIKKFRSQGIELASGQNFGDSKSAILCYAMHLSQCERLLKRLKELRTV
jgi:hypothetical protein